MPLIVDALLPPGVAREAFPFRRPNYWGQLVQLVRAGISAGQLQLDHVWDISAADQEQVLSTCLGPISSGICAKMAADYAIGAHVNIKDLMEQAAALEQAAAVQQAAAGAGGDMQ
eukprot:XP_001696844.1 predicted protein [Chlamydomonas reinhardtii]